MKKFIIGIFSAITMWCAANAQQLSDYIGGQYLTSKQKTELLNYQGRSPLLQLERNLLIVKIDIDNNRYSLDSYLTYISPYTSYGGKLRFLIQDYDNRIAYFNSPEFKVLTWWDVYETQYAARRFEEIHIYGPK